MLRQGVIRTVPKLASLSSWWRGTRVKLALMAFVSACRTHRGKTWVQCRVGFEMSIEWDWERQHGRFVQLN